MTKKRTLTAWALTAFLLVSGAVLAAGLSSEAAGPSCSAQSLICNLKCSAKAPSNGTVLCQSGCNWVSCQAFDANGVLISNDFNGCRPPCPAD